MLKNCGLVGKLLCNGNSAFGPLSCFFEAFLRGKSSKIAFVLQTSGNVVIQRKLQFLSNFRACIAKKKHQICVKIAPEIVLHSRKNAQNLQLQAEDSRKNAHKML